MQTSVILPGGARVMCSTPDEVWCSQNGGSGYVDPAQLASDPDQPRQHMDKTELDDLERSIKEVGVREPITVTPLFRAPWVEVTEEDRHCFFLIVSGHRRVRTSKHAGHKAVPIRVVLYDSKASHLLDRSILNKGRSALSPLEEGYEAVGLQAAGVPLARIAATFSCSVSNLHNRIFLTKLSPELQKRLDPSLPRRQALSVSIGSAIGNIKTPTVGEIREFLANNPDVDFGRSCEGLSDEGRRFLIQHLIMQVIDVRRYGSARAISFVKSQTLLFRAVSSSSKRNTRRFRPDKLQALFENWLKSIERSAVIDWTPAEWRQTFANLSLEQCQALRERLVLMRGLVEDVEKEFNRHTPAPTVGQAKVA